MNYILLFLLYCVHGSIASGRDSDNLTGSSEKKAGFVNDISQDGSRDAEYFDQRRRNELPRYFRNRSPRRMLAGREPSAWTINQRDFVPRSYFIPQPEERLSIDDMSAPEVAFGYPPLSFHDYGLPDVELQSRRGLPRVRGSVLDGRTHPKQWRLGSELNDDISLEATEQATQRDIVAPDLHPESRFCDNSICLHGGQCILESSSFKCVCEIGYRGDRCEVLDPCSPNPCMHGGACSPEGEHFKCNCAPHYQGMRCEVLDPCNNQVCQNGGTCHVVNGSTTCICPSVFSGLHCEFLDACASKPCKGGGTCTSVNSTYICKCPDAYGGDRCEVFDSCHGVICLHGGMCKSSSSNVPSCTCIPGFYGNRCELSDSCIPNPCKNGGSCTRDTGGGFSCNCTSEFIGVACEAKNACIPNPCSRGICRSYNSTGYECECPMGFYGHQCDQVDHCSPNPCRNGGSCMDHSSGQGFVCSCTSGFIGSDCARSDVCVTKPCQHGGTCVSEPETPSGFRCRCTPNISGDFCEAPTNITVTHSSSANTNISTEVHPPTPHVTSMDVASDEIPPIILRRGNKEVANVTKYFGKDECQHCHKDATCIADQCMCLNGFIGDGMECWRETEQDLRWVCDNNPCLNGGTCHVGRSRCTCRLGFSGDLCEIHCSPILYLSMDKIKGNMLEDGSPQKISTWTEGEIYADSNGKCGQTVLFKGGEIILEGTRFRQVPFYGITVVAWVQLNVISGSQSIFAVRAGTSSTHREGAFHLEVNDGKVRWFHRNHLGFIVFSVVTNKLVFPGKWTHVACTYDQYKLSARIYIDGDLVGMEPGQGLVSADWLGRASLGRYTTSRGDRSLLGYLDEVYIFPCSLPRLEVLVLMNHCKLYFDQRLRSQSAATYGIKKSFSTVVATVMGRKGIYPNGGTPALKSVHPSSLVNQPLPPLMWPLPTRISLQTSSSQGATLLDSVMSHPLVQPSRPKVYYFHPSQLRSDDSDQTNMERSLEPYFTKSGEYPLGFEQTGQPIGTPPIMQTPWELRTLSDTAKSMDIPFTDAEESESASPAVWVPQAVPWQVGEVPAAQLYSSSVPYGPWYDPIQQVYRQRSLTEYPQQNGVWTTTTTQQSSSTTSKTSQSSNNPGTLKVVNQVKTDGAQYSAGKTSNGQKRSSRIFYFAPPTTLTLDRSFPTIHSRTMIWKRQLAMGARSAENDAKTMSRSSVSANIPAPSSVHRLSSSSQPSRLKRQGTGSKSQAQSEAQSKASSSASAGTPPPPPRTPPPPPPHQQQSSSSSQSSGYGYGVGMGVGSGRDVGIGYGVGGGGGSSNGDGFGFGGGWGWGSAGNVKMNFTFG